MRVRLLFDSKKNFFHLILMVLLFALPAYTQVRMPQEAERIYQQSDLSNFPLSESGQRAVLSDFAQKYLFDVILTRAHEKLKECENNTPIDADCRKLNTCCEEEKKAIDRLNAEYAEYEEIRLAAFHAWEELWLSRMGIAYTIEANGNVVVAESGTQEADKYYDWRYKTSPSDIYLNLPDPYDVMRSKLGIEPHIRDEWLTSQQRAQLAPAKLKSIWIHFALEEHYKCRHMIDIQGKDPMDCSYWRKSTASPPPQPPPTPPTPAQSSVPPPSDREKIEAIPIGDFVIITISDTKQTFVNVARVKEGWLFDIPVQGKWKNRDDIIEQLRALGFSPIDSYPQYTPYQSIANDLEKALFMLSEVRKVLILVD